MVIEFQPPVELCTTASNLNISAYRVLYILLMLVKYRRLDLMELNRHLYENPLIARGYNNETLTKYVNTLRWAGCRIPKASIRNEYHYELVKNPFPLQLSKEEIEIAGKLLNVLSEQTDESLAKDYRDFLDHLSWSIDLPTWPECTPDYVAWMDNQRFFYELACRRKLLNTFRQYCQDAFHLELDYRDSNSDVIHAMHVEPQEVIQREDILYLDAVDCHSQETVSLDLTRIENSRQLPSKNRRTKSHLIATFVVSGRLAQSYRLYADEWIIYKNEGELHIKSKVDNVDTFLDRLLKYGENCEVLAPTNLREMVRDRIKTLLMGFSASVN